MTGYPLAELNECVIPLYYAKKMKLSAYPTLTADFQTVVKNYPTLHPTLEPTLYPTLEGKRTTNFFAEQSGRAERTNFFFASLR